MRGLDNLVPEVFSFLFFNTQKMREDRKPPEPGKSIRLHMPKQLVSVVIWYFFADFLQRLNS